MAGKSKIEWTATKNKDGTITKGKVWNPVGGCLRKSSGCINCYAERQAIRMSGEGKAYEGLVKSTPKGPRWTGEVKVASDNILTAPLGWKKPVKIFVNSMSDLFYKRNFEVIAGIFGIMAACPQHTFQVLTKYTERMVEFFEWLEATAQDLRRSACHTGDNAVDYHRDRIMRNAARKIGVPQRYNLTHNQLWPLKNVWLGVSVENQAAANERIPHLLEVPAAVRWLSMEPLIGPVDLSPWIKAWEHCSNCGAYYDQTQAVPDPTRSDNCKDECSRCGAPGHMITAWGDAQLERIKDGTRYEDEHAEDLEGAPLSWVVVGGESGHSARPMHPMWATSLRDQCVDAGVPFFFKQHGQWVEDRQGKFDDLNVPTMVIDPEGGEIENHDFALFDGNLAMMRKVGKTKAGRKLCGREWSEYPAQTTPEPSSRIEQLRKYSEKDGDHEGAIKSFADAEVEHHDPAEGTLVIDDKG